MTNAIAFEISICINEDSQTHANPHRAPDTPQSINEPFIVNLSEYNSLPELSVGLIFLVIST